MGRHAYDFIILGEDSAQLSAELKEQFADVAWRQPARLRRHIRMGTGQISERVLSHR